MTREARTCECGNHAWMKLTRGHVALVDAVYAPVVSQWRWQAITDGRNWYASRNHHTWVEGKRHSLTIRLHRQILPVPHGWMVDHISRDTLDNRLGNLRAATASQNSINSKAGKINTTSRFRGVSRSRDRWRSLIISSGKQSYLGSFDTEEEAARAHDSAARVLHGQFATLNFPVQVAP